MNPTQEQLNNRLRDAGVSPSIIPPQVPSTMDASSIQSSGSLNLQPQTSLSVPNVANLASAPVTPIPIVPIAPPTSPNLFQRITGGVSDLISGSKNKEVDLQNQISQETQPYSKQLNELNTQIQMQQANALSNQEKALRSGETTGFASREAQNVARTDAIETLKLSSLAEGMRGNIALAEQHATQAVNAKYADINKQIEDAKTNIYNNYDSFTASEKKQADMTLLRLDSQDAFAKNAMENEKAVSAVIQTAIKQSQENGNPVPSIILSQANKLSDPTEATQLLAPYLKDAAKIQQQIDAHNTSLRLNGGSGTGGNSDTDLIAQAIINGNQPPVLTGLYGKSAAVKAALEKNGYNLTQATQDYTATQKLLSTLNGAQQTKLRQSITQVDESLPLVQSLAEQWDGGNFPALNKVNLLAAKNGLYGQKAQSVATQLDAEISDVVSELATVYKGGNSSTDESLKLAGTQLSSNWSKQTLLDAIDLAKKNISYRKNSLNLTTAGIQDSQYSPNKPQTSLFDKYVNDINDSGIMTRSVWKNVDDKDGLLAYMKSLGVNLKISD